MRKSLLAFALTLGIFFSTSAQWVAIPDSNFGTWLKTSYPQCMQGNNAMGWLMDTTCSAVVSENFVDCSLWDIQSLDGIQYFDSLIELWCMRNQLTMLPTLPPFLTSLKCDQNSLQSLPTLPDSLVGLECGANHLTLLPTLPKNLSVLYCEDNLLSQLPILPDSVRSIICNNNQLSTLPHLPPTLNYLDCSNNSIAYLPELPQTIQVCLCYSNSLVALPELPEYLFYFHCYNNPTLNCLPKLNTVLYFDFSNTNITCLPNLPQNNTTSNPPLNTMQLCNLFNEDGCKVYWNINGLVYNKISPDCLSNVEDTALCNLKVNLYKSGDLVQQMNIVSGGGYSFNVDFSTYQYSVDTANYPFYVSCPDSSYYTSVITAQDSFDADMNFGLRCKPGFDLEARSIASPTVFRPANFTQVNITAGDASNFYNAHCATGVSGEVTITINGSAHYTAPANGALTPAVNGNTLTYTIADFGAVDFFHAFNIMVQTDTTAVIGDTICITVSVTPTVGDNNLANNTLTICFPVVNSFDPNDKTAYPAGDIDAAQKEITYTVRFQNTGTVEAQHIYIADTLDTDIDESSFQLLAYSHQPMVQVEKNHVRFNFPNINLPDSNTNEPLSHGYVQYKVKLKDNLPIGTTINNTAYIYFDFNAPVITNTTGSTIIINTSVTEIRRVEPDFKLNPNPTRDAFTVSVSENFIGETVTVTDITGKQMAVVQLQTLNIKLETSNWSSGVYLVRVGNVVKKLVIQR